jgi:ribosomal protein L31
VNLQKHNHFRSKTLRQAAYGQSCIACGADDGTVVLAHRNEGKASMLKVDDFLALDLCLKCHSAYDQGRDMTQAERRAFFNEHYPKQIARWVERELVRFA